MKFKQKKSISYFIAAYNCQDTILEAIKSIFNDNFIDGDELIIVNDCSTDSTSKILEKLTKIYPIKVINHVVNKGGGSTRNTAIENSKNSLLFCLDSDNILEKGTVGELKNYLVKTKSDISSFEEIKYFKSTINSVTHSWIFDQPFYTLADVFSKHKVPGASGNYLFTKNSWLKANYYPVSVGALDTWGFGFKQLASGSMMTVLPNSYYYHRYGHDSYWVRESRNGNISLKAFTIILPYLNCINPEDIEYILSKKNRHSWFEKMDKRPIRLENNSNIINKIIKYIR